MAIRKSDQLAPYQIRREDDFIWLEDTRDGTRWFFNEFSKGVLKFITSQRNQLNSAFCMDEMGIF